MTLSAGDKAKRIVRAGFRKLGYDIRKLPRNDPASAREVVFQEGTRGHQIEFVGPSGVGKSTLFSELGRLRGDGDRWVPVIELLRQRDLSRVRVDQVDDVYEKLFELKMSSVYAWELGSMDKYRVLEYFHRVLIIDATINTVWTDSHIVLEDGLMHNFGDAVMDLRKQWPHRVDWLLANRAIVHCHATPQTIAEQILRREEQGYTMVLHQGLNRDELVEFSATSLAKKAILVRFLRERGVPCLDVETSDDLETNVQRVRGFAEKLNLS